MIQGIIATTAYCEKFMSELIRFMLLGTALTLSPLTLAQQSQTSESQNTEIQNAAKPTTEAATPRFPPKRKLKWRKPSTKNQLLLSTL